VGNGIGAFMECLGILTKVSIWTTLGCAYFTSRIYKQLFVKRTELKEALGIDTKSQFSHLDLIEFLIVIITIEHGMMVFQMILEFWFSEMPEAVITG
jgi:hypothetical protein